MKYISKLSAYMDSIALSKAVKNFGWLFFERVIKLVVGFFVGVLVVRYLGAESFGQLSYALAYAALFQAISNLGVDAIVVRDMAKNRDAAGEILVNVIKLKLASALLCTCVGILVSFLYLEDSAAIIQIIIVISSILFSVGNVVDLFFQSQSASRLTVLARMKSYVINISIKLIVIFFSLNNIVIFILIPLEALLVSVFLYISFYKYDLKEKLKISYFDMKYVLRLLSESWPLAVSSVSVIVFMKIGIFLVGNKLGFNSVGIYSVGVNLAEMSYMFPTLLLTSFAPIIAKAKKKGEVYYEHEIMYFFRIMYIGSIVCALCIGALGYALIPYIYGAEYTQSKNVFIIHVFTLIPVAFGCAQSAWLVNEGRTKVALYQALVGAILTVILSVILIDKYGVIGAAIAILVAQVFQSLLVNFFFCRPLFKMTWKTIFLR